PVPAQVEVRGLTLAHGGQVIQQDLSFALARGEICLVMGAPGWEKTMLMRHLVGLSPPAAGEVFYAGEPLWAAEPARREQFKRRFGVLFQNGALFSCSRLVETVALPLAVHARLSPAAAAEVARLKLALVGLCGFEQHYPSEISGRMRKRGCRARGLGPPPTAPCA